MSEYLTIDIDLITSENYTDLKMEQDKLFIWVKCPFWQFFFSMIGNSNNFATM